MEESSAPSPARSTPSAATTANSTVQPEQSDEDAMRMAIAMSIEPSATARSTSEESGPDISRLIGILHDMYFVIIY